MGNRDWLLKEGLLQRILRESWDAILVSFPIGIPEIFLWTGCSHDSFQLNLAEIYSIFVTPAFIWSIDFCFYMFTFGLKFDGITAV